MRESEGNECRGGSKVLGLVLVLVLVYLGGIKNGNCIDLLQTMIGEYILILITLISSLYLVRSRQNFEDILIRKVTLGAHQLSNLFPVRLIIL